MLPLTYFIRLVRDISLRHAEIWDRPGWVAAAQRRDPGVLMTSDGNHSSLQGPKSDPNAPINYVLKQNDYL